MFFLRFEEQGEFSRLNSDRRWDLGSPQVLRAKHNQWDGVIPINRPKRSSNHFFSPKNHGHHLEVPKGSTVGWVFSTKSNNKFRNKLWNLKRIVYGHPKQTARNVNHGIAIQQPILCSCMQQQTFFPLHSPDLAPNDYHLFTTLKKDFGGKTFDEKGEVCKYLAINFTTME